MGAFKKKRFSDLVSPRCLAPSSARTMRALFIALTVLSALITEGDCLVCETCQAQGSISCTGTLQTCAEGVTYCVKGFENKTVGESYTVLTAFKKCLAPVKEKACNRNIIFRSLYITLGIMRMCCSSDGCNKGNMFVPIIDETPNGLTCPTCFNDVSAEGCSGYHLVKCNGNEGYCGSFTGRALIPGTETLQVTVYKGVNATCMEPKKVGRCRGSFPRWYYDAASRSCLPFIFGGCQPNNNNFLSEEKCNIHCGGGRDDPVTGYSIEGCHNQDACEAGILDVEESEVYDFKLTCT